MISKHMAACAAGLAVLFSVPLAISSPRLTEHWPVHKVTPHMKELAEAIANKYMADKTNTHLRAQIYGSDGDYLNYGKYVSHSESEKLRRDDNGLPMTYLATDLLGHKEWQYAPGTLANFALAAHGRHLLGQAPLKQFLDAAEKLKEIESPDGAMRNDYVFRHYTQPKYYPRGWISGMDQGLALSVFYRAYKLTGDESYIDAGNRAFAFMQVPFPDGPMNTLADFDRSLNGYIWIDEYLATPNVYTLNGYMFALLGLYDWSHVTPSARKIFQRGLVSLKKMLPYYDLDAFTAYDLSFMTNPQPKGPHFGQAYHGVHIAQLKALYSVTGEEVLNDTANKWMSYINSIHSVASNKLNRKDTQ
jgi:hypothetical protein